MKRKIVYFIIVCLVMTCINHVKTNSAEAEISTTVEDLSGVKRKLTIDSVKNVGTPLERYNYPSEYAQVADGHYYYMRQIKSYWYTIYRDQGEKAGSFKDTLQGPGYRWHAFGWHEGKLYVEFVNEDDRMIKIGVADFKKERIKIICTCTFSASFKVRDMEVYLYQNKVYAMYGWEGMEFELSSGNLLDTFSVPEPGKKESMNFINIADGKIYYAIESLQGKKQIVTFRCRDTVTSEDKKVFCCHVPGGRCCYHDLIMKGREIYYYKASGSYDYAHDFVYSIPSTGGKMQQIGQGEIRGFACHQKYYFYIDKKYRLHRQNRKTGRDKTISGLNVSKVNCTEKGIYVQEYDKFFIQGGYQNANEDYAPALYFMDFKGGNVKKIAKYTPGHMSCEAWL